MAYGCQTPSAQRRSDQNQLPMLSGSALKVKLGGGVGGVDQLITLSTPTMNVAD